MLYSVLVLPTLLLLRPRVKSNGRTVQTIRQQMSLPLQVTRKTLPGKHVEKAYLGLIVSVKNKKHVGCELGRLNS